MCRTGRFVTQVYMCHDGLLHPSTIIYIRYFSQCYPSPSPPPPNRPWCVMFPFLCPCILIVQFPLMSKDMQCLVFCSCVHLLRMMVFGFIHIPAKDINSSFLWLQSIPWCICATFSLASLSLMGIGLVPSLFYCKQCCGKHMCACVFLVEGFLSLWVYTQ